MERESHLPDEALLEAFEEYIFSGKSQTGSSAVTQHLKDCASCRERLDQMRNAVTSFVDDREYRYSLERRPPPRGLRTLEAKPEQKSRSFFFPIPKLRWAAGLAASIGLVTLFLIRPEQAISANEALDRSVLAEQNTGSVHHNVIYRRMHVESPAGSAEWEVWSAPSQKRRRDRWSGQSKIGAQMQAIYERNRFIPLSASNHQQWRKSSQAANDEVSFDRAGGLLTVSTTRVEPVPTGEIVQATLVIRNSDWRPVKQGLRIRSGEGYIEYWLRELDYRTTPFTEEAWSAITASAAAAPVKPATSNKSPELKDIPLLDSPATELRVLEALQRAGLDTETDFEIRSDSHTVQFLAYACPLMVRTKITSLLSGIPGVQVRFPTAPRSPAVVQQIYQGNSSTLPPLILKQLVSAVGGEQAAGERIAQVNAAFAVARAHALALNRLVTRNHQLASAWSTREDLRPLAEALTREHAGQVAKRINTIQELLQPVMHARSAVASRQNCNVWAGALSSIPQQISDAQHVSDRLFTVTADASPADPQSNLDDLSMKLETIWNRSEECVK